MAPSGPSLGPGRLRSLCGATGGLRFFHSLPGPGFLLVPLILGRAQEIIHGFSAFRLISKCSIRSYHHHF
jgi:uncharacterized protein YqgC (DUF456 family)